MKPLLVGECNSYQDNEEDAMHFAFHPDPPYASGGRLCHNIMQLTERDYLRMFDRTNLCWPKWSMGAARTKAVQLMNERAPEDVIVLFGVNVMRAFDVPPNPWCVYEGEGLPESALHRPKLLTLPHPSGRNRVWYQAGAIKRARALLIEVGVPPSVTTFGGGKDE